MRRRCPPEPAPPRNPVVSDHAFRITQRWRVFLFRASTPDPPTTHTLAGGGDLSALPPSPLSALVPPQGAARALWDAGRQRPLRPAPG